MLLEIGFFFLIFKVMIFCKYGNALRDDYHFVPIAVETWGFIGHTFIPEIGRTISEITKNPKSTSYTFQVAISMAIQRGNVQCDQGAQGESAFEELANSPTYIHLTLHLLFFRSLFVLFVLQQYVQDSNKTSLLFGQDWDFPGISANYSVHW